MKVQVELFTANVCARCEQAKSMLRGLVEELSDDRVELKFIDVVENLDQAVAKGVLATPALVVNGKLVYSPLPKRATVMQTLKAELGK